ncbi:hypothetical protein PVAP13_1NG123738 [Panicum virgatum]|uniref:Uncharacterized protein n=1 Tax=Panicum virgatum TaxID=38727 RepID=A0A8T0WRP8_PANVG|nr:hypothetical protein PVAP13_1NG123738 [Panicum virgatum]
MTSKTPLSHVQEGQGFHPWRKTRKGEEVRHPQRGKTAPTGVSVVKAFAQRYPLRTKHQASMILLPATTIVENASPHDHASRGATTRQLHMAAAQLCRQPPPPNEQPVAPLTQSHRKHPPPEHCPGHAARRRQSRCCEQARGLPTRGLVKPAAPPRRCRLPVPSRRHHGAADHTRLAAAGTPAAPSPTLLHRSRGRSQAAPPHKEPTGGDSVAGQNLLDGSPPRTPEPPAPPTPAPHGRARQQRGGEGPRGRRGRATPPRPPPAAKAGTGGSPARASRSGGARAGSTRSQAGSALMRLRRIGAPPCRGPQMPSRPSTRVPHRPNRPAVAFLAGRRASGGLLGRPRGSEGGDGGYEQRREAAPRSPCGSDAGGRGLFFGNLRPFLVLKIFPTIPVTSNLRTHTLSIKCS